MADTTAFLKHWQARVAQEASAAETHRHQAALRFTRAYNKFAIRASADLHTVFRASSEWFSPLEDPFVLGFSRNRWLHPERSKEISYSDWLAWLIEQCDDPIAVLRLLDLDATDFTKRFDKPCPYSVDREYTIEDLTKN